MTIKTMDDVRHFQEAIEKCKDSVWLISATEKYNLKSALSQYVAIGKLLSGNKELELFAETKEDESHLLQMFYCYPELG